MTLGWRHGHAADTGLVIGLAAISLIAALAMQIWAVGHAPVPLVVIVGVAVQVTASCAVLVHRTAPVTVAGVLLLTAIGLVLAKLLASGNLLFPAHAAFRWDDQPYRFVDPWVPAAVGVAAYIVARSGHRYRAWFVWAQVGVLALIATRPWQPAAWPAIPGGLLFTTVPALIGVYLAARRRLIGTLVERAERAERERHLLAAAARAEERTRLAADLHDVLTHRVSLMVLQAGALRVTTADPAARDAAEELRATGCQALEELREMLAVLRSPPETTAPVRDPGGVPLPELTVLTAEHESAGVPVELRHDGQPALLTPAVARTAYRIVQEALTNVRKHAPGAAASVSLRYAGDHVRVSIRNPAPPGGGRTELVGTGSGTGLLGLRERVDLVHGGFRTGPTEDGGFEVTATLPTYVPADRP